MADFKRKTGELCDKYPKVEQGLLLALANDFALQYFPLARTLQQALKLHGEGKEFKKIDRFIYTQWQVIFADFYYYTRKELQQLPEDTKNILGSIIHITKDIGLRHLESHVQTSMKLPKRVEEDWVTRARCGLAPPPRTH